MFVDMWLVRFVDNPIGWRVSLLLHAHVVVFAVVVCFLDAVFTVLFSVHCVSLLLLRSRVLSSARRSLHTIAHLIMTHQ